MVSRCMPGAGARTARLKAQHTYTRERWSAHPSWKDVFECSILSQVT
jgi:hypothetical protein